MRVKAGIKVYHADELWDSPKHEVVTTAEVLDRLIDNLVTLVDLSEFAASLPEIVVTVSPQLFQEMSDAQAYGHLQATDEGTVPGTDLKYLIFRLAKSKARLIVQEGSRTSALEIVS